ncbi:MAG TPA: hypothetical protein VJ302_38595 [Blastocatellia bacterium]|nr:hypothetical protein [Blastocatellia bacterium]
MNETESVALASLLHGIERFRQRTAGKAMLGIPFSDPHSDHHLKLIEEADRLTSRVADESAAVEESAPGPSTIYLESVTHRVAIPRGERQHKTSVRGPRYYPLQPLNLFDVSADANSGSARTPSIVPVRSGEVESRSVPGGYDRLWELFLGEAARLPQGSVRAYLDSLLYLLRKYAWCVPSCDRGTDLSLYDRSRVTGAVAVCLHAVRQTDPRDEPEFLLIEGSLSGIQRFVYTPALNCREPQDGLARRLRGRSFYLTLLVKTLADYLSERLELSSLNLLWATGGRFLIVAPNTESCRAGLAALRLEIQRWLWSEFHGALQAVIADLAITRDQLLSFGRLQRQLDAVRERMRVQQFAAPLSFNDEPPDDAWEDPWTLRMGQGICADTGRDLSAEDRELSRRAQIGEEHPAMAAPAERGARSLLFDALGRALIGAQTLQLRRSGEWPEPAATAARLPRSVEEAERLRGSFKEALIEFPAFNRVWLLSGESIPHPQADLCLRLADHRNKSIEFLSGEAPAGIARGFELMATAVKTRRDRGRESIAGFQDLADRAAGAKYAGALRMDVDDLGWILTQGLRDADDSITRIAALSQLFDWFFSGYLNTLVEGRDLYTTYAGGDDLFVIGAWDQALDLAEQIYLRFRDLCGNHPDLHLSAALTLCKGHYPVGRAAEEAGAALDSIAKTPPQLFRDSDRKRRRIEGESDKDALVFMERKISWRKWREVRGLGDQLIKACQAGRLSRRFLYQLLELYRAHIDPQRDSSREFADEDLIWVPRFKFSLVRHVKDAQLRATLVRAVEQNRYYLAVLAGYVLLRTQGRNRKDHA